MVLEAASFRSVGGGTRKTRLGAWADFSRVSQSMGRSRIGVNNGGFFCGQRFYIEDFVCLRGVGWRGNVAEK